MTPARKMFTHRLLNAAAAVDGWPEAPRIAQVLDVLNELDLLALHLGRLIVPDEPPQSLHQSARALYAMSAHPPCERDDAKDTLRVALRCVAAAQRGLNRMKESP